METFLTYLSLGWEHIVSMDALDHQLFLIALIWPVSVLEIRKLLLLITAFTIGHSITLAMSSSGIVKISSELIEFLIPASIFITALLQWFGSESKNSFQAFFGLTGIFGLLHGLGFANTLKQMLGREESLLVPLLGFNIGVEAGQILVLALLLLLKYFLRRFLPAAEQLAGKLVLISVLIGSAWMVWERMPL
jgi:hypothetical protein